MENCFKNQLSANLRVRRGTSQDQIQWDGQPRELFFTKKKKSFMLLIYYINLQTVGTTALYGTTPVQATV